MFLDDFTDRVSTSSWVKLFNRKLAIVVIPLVSEIMVK